MNENDSVSLVYSIILLTLVAASLVARRLPISEIARNALLWIGIFGGAFVLFSFRAPLKSAWTHLKSELSPGGTQIGSAVRLRADDGGHFWVNAEINGREVRLMVDSGATTTTISSETARRIGVEVDRSAFPVLTSTANGTAESWRATAESFNILGIKRDAFPIHVSDTLGDTDLLGVNFLSTLKSWRVEGDQMVFEP